MRAHCHTLAAQRVEDDEVVGLAAGEIDLDVAVAGVDHVEGEAHAVVAVLDVEERFHFGVPVHRLRLGGRSDLFGMRSAAAGDADGTGAEQRDGDTGIHRAGQAGGAAQICDGASQSQIVHRAKLSTK